MNNNGGGKLRQIAGISRIENTHLSEEKNENG